MLRRGWEDQRFGCWQSHCAPYFRCAAHNLVPFENSVPSLSWIWSALKKNLWRGVPKSLPTIVHVKHISKQNREIQVLLLFHYVEPVDCRTIVVRHTSPTMPTASLACVEADRPTTMRLLSSTAARPSGIIISYGPSPIDSRGFLNTYFPIQA
jgi:hypothetical protein